MKLVLYPLAAVGAWAAVSLVTTPLIGRWIERHSQVDDELGQLAATPIPACPDLLDELTARLDDQQRIGDRYVCEQLERENGLV